MTDASTGLAIVTFGDLSGQTWGAVLVAGDPVLVLGTPDGAVVSADPGQITYQAGNGRGRVSGEGVELTITASDREPSPAGDELVHVQGLVTTDGTEHELDCLGVRGRDREVDPGRLESLHAISGWFEGGRGLALRALRAPGRLGQDQDLMAATLLDPEEFVAVVDPRLSTTYDRGERPLRTSLELWVGDGDELYPRRSAAEALGPGADAQGKHVRVSVTPMRCHAAGLDGAGTYLIAHFSF